MRPLTLVGLIGSAIGALWLAAVWLVEKMTAPGRLVEEPRGFTPFETGVEWESVVIAAEDGSPMAGWLFVSSRSAPSILACGGYRGRRSDLLGISSALWRAGFNVLLFDYRGHGEGAGAPVTLGHHELADARSALAVLRGRFPGSSLGVIGFSMGAAVALMVAARDADVRAVVADSPFTSLSDIVRYRVGRAAGRFGSPWLRPLGDALVGLAGRRLRRRFGFSFSDVDPLRDAVHLTQPLLLVHGLNDRDVPAEHSRRVAMAAEAAGVPIETWFVPACTHCQAYFIDRPGYCARVVGFFRRHLDANR